MRHHMTRQHCLLVFSRFSMCVYKSVKIYTFFIVRLFRKQFIINSRPHLLSRLLLRSYFYDSKRSIGEVLFFIQFYRSDF